MFAILAVLAGLAGAGVKYWTTRPDPAIGLLSMAADKLATAQALHLDIGYLDPGGQTTDAEVTVTADHYTAGTVTDPDGGTAQLVSSPALTAVNGDTDYWARRAPTQADLLPDRWIQPDTGNPYPFDINTNLGPAVIAGLVLSLPDCVTSGYDSIDNHTLREIACGDWTALLSTDPIPNLVWLAGPVQPNQFQPAPHPHFNDRHIGSPRHTSLPPLRPAQNIPIYQPPLLAVTPTPADAAAGDTRAAVVRILPQAQPAAPGDNTGRALPPAQSAPAFQPADFQINSPGLGNCTEPVCDVAVSVTNTGKGPGSGTLAVTFTPGMPVEPFTITNLAPGQSHTFNVQFPNPARAVAVASGQSATLPVNGYAWLADTGQDAIDIANLANQLTSQYGFAANSLPKVNPSYQPTLFRAAKLMLDKGINTADTTSAITNAVGEELLPELHAIVNSGRLQNPGALAKKLKDLSDTRWPPSANSYVNDAGKNDIDPGQIGYRREIEQAATILRHDPTAKIVLDDSIPDPTNPNITYAADILDTTNNVAYQIKSVSSNEKLIKRINEAIKQLNGLNPGPTGGLPENAPPGYAKVALIYLEDANPLTRYSEADLRRKLAKAQLKLCDANRAPLATMLTIVTARGTYTWSSNDFASLSKSCQ